MLLDLFLPFVRSDRTRFEDAVTSNDPLHKKWCETASAARHEFLQTADKSTRGLTPIKETYKDSYKQFQQYLTTTIDLVENLPQFSHGRLSVVYTSGINGLQMSTAGEGKPCLSLDVQTACLVEMILAKWVYASTVYNNILDEYRRFDSYTNFQELQEGLATITKGLEDVLVRLCKLEYLYSKLGVWTF